MIPGALRVNGVSAEWDYDGRRKLLPCECCGGATKGRLLIDREGQPLEVKAICSEHATQATCDATIRPVGRVIQAIREALVR